MALSIFFTVIFFAASINGYYIGRLGPLEKTLAPWNIESDRALAFFKGVPRKRQLSVNFHNNRDYWMDKDCPDAIQEEPKAEETNNRA